MKSSLLRLLYDMVKASDKTSVLSSLQFDSMWLNTVSMSSKGDVFAIGGRNGNNK